MNDKHHAKGHIPDRAAFADVRRALDRLRRGDPVALDVNGRRNVIFAVETLDAAGLALARGLAPGGLKVAITALRATALGLEPIPGEPTEVELQKTAELDWIRAFADPTSLAGRAGLTGGPARDVAVSTAALTLAKLAGLMPAVVVGTVYGRASDVPAVSAAHALRFAEESARWLNRVAEARVPLADAEHATIIAFRPYDGGAEHLAIVVGDIDATKPVLVRIHSACFTGDLIGSLRCDCGDQLRGALRAMADQGSGVVVYLPQEGRGIGLVNKLRAYALQDSGLDTIDANLHLGFAPDERTYAAAGEILRQLGVTRIRLLTNNPEKIEALARLGCEIVERVPHAFAANPHNEAYLQTKARRAGHNI